MGSHVSDYLSKNCYNVTVFDVKKSKYLKNNQKMHIGDILDKDSVDSAVKGKDYVFHFAGLADINESRTKPVETVTNNILGTTNILESCRKRNVKRLIFASTIYVYSDLGSFYRSSKQACELIIENYKEEYDLNYSILRFGSLYGRRANDFNFIRNAILQAIKSGRIERKGDGSEIRDYIHVKDAAKASVEILNDKFKNSHIMIKGLQTIKVRELLMMINEILGNKIKIKYFQKAQYAGHYQLTPYSFRPRVAEKYLLETYYDLGQGLLDTIYDEYKKIYKEDPSKIDKSIDLLKV